MSQPLLRPCRAAASGRWAPWVCGPPGGVARRALGHCVRRRLGPEGRCRGLSGAGLRGRPGRSWRSPVRPGSGARVDGRRGLRRRRAGPERLSPKPLGPEQLLEQSSLCCTVGPCCLSILNPASLCLFNHFPSALLPEDRLELLRKMVPMRGHVPVHLGIPPLLVARVRTRQPGSPPWPEGTEPRPQLHSVPHGPPLVPSSWKQPG